MVLQRYGALSLDLSEDWEDQSILTFVRRPRARMATAAVQDMARNLVINRAPCDGSFDAADLAAHHLESLKAALPDVEILKEEQLDLAGSAAVVREVRFSTPTKGLAQQLHAFVVKDELVLTCVGTASAGMAFQGLRKELMDILQSLRVDEG